MAQDPATVGRTPQDRRAAGTHQRQVPGGPPGENGRFAELEAYRGLAALLIVVYHAYQQSRVTTAYVYQGTPVHVVFRNLEATVAWFFALSGFLIFLPFARAIAEGSRAQSARGFLVRRAIRIVPVYYAAILIVWSVRYTGGPGQWRDLAEHLSFTQIFDRVHIFWTIGPSWSLAVEVLFYLLIAIASPLAYRACRRLSTPGARLTMLACGVSLLIAASIAYKAWAWWVGHVPEADYPVYFGPVAKLDTFGFGMLLAIVLLVAGRRPLLRGRMPMLFRLIGLALLAADFGLRASSPAVNLYFHTLSGLAFVLILASTVLGPRGSTWERMLGWRPLQYLGLVSYSVYLWHEPLMIALHDRHMLAFESVRGFPLSTLMLIGVSLLVATISYWAIEYPATLLRHLFSRDGRLQARYHLPAQGKSSNTIEPITRLRVLLAQGKSLNTIDLGTHWVSPTQGKSEDKTGIVQRSPSHAP